ncbi:hypothetical protein M378DRAFT_177418 [Amanita muscaria Koide BX008]|uniref:No apical meristem-associated C-terminal domain-containing protein n=1 Tax=Amanita muscaria (strain Koide BX008) TaxID=946122 RepID=A0A0C2XD08_AMAMK|nr:hypothetical protein M378DRAFT_177418 [Amanita muscaria Koide BX008]
MHLIAFTKLHFQFMVYLLHIILEMSLEHQQYVENDLLWDPDLDSRLAIVEAAAKGANTVNTLRSNFQPLPNNNDTSFWQTAMPSQPEAARTVYGQLSETLVYPITPTRPVVPCPSQFHHQRSFYTSPPVAAQPPPQVHMPFHGQFTFAANVTPPSDTGSGASKRRMDVKSAENDSVAPPSKKSRQIDSSEKENRPEKANGVPAKLNSGSQDKVDKVEIIGSPSGPNMNSGSVDLGAAKRGGKKLMKKEKARLKAEEEALNSVRCHWSDSDKTALFEWLLGPDSDKIADKLKVNPGRVFRKAVESVFIGKYNESSIKGQYDRSLKTFTYILQLEAFTGGGGDADENGYDTRIDAARRNGVQVGNLTSKTIVKWFDLGWYDLFKSRHGKSPKVTRPVVYSSSQPLSDIDSDLAGRDTSSNSDDSDTSPVKTALSSKRKPSREALKVSEPKYKPPSGKGRQQNLASASGLTEYLKSKTELDKARFDGLKFRQRIDLAKEMLADSTNSSELRAAAEAILLKALQE